MFYGSVASFTVLATSTGNRPIKAILFWLIIILVIVASIALFRRWGARRRHEGAPDDWHQHHGEDELKGRE